MVRHTDAEAKRIEPDEVDFEPHAIAAAWEAAADLPVCVGVAIANEVVDDPVHAADGEAVDRDVVFGHKTATPLTADVLVEEKAVGVCPRDVAEEHAPTFVALPDRDDDHVLAVNPAQVFDNR